MQDNLLLATIAGGAARLAVAITTGLVDEARRRHDTYPTATAALGRTLTAALLLATNLKGEDTLTIRILGDGPLGAVIVSAAAQGTVKGYVQEPHTHLQAKEGGKLNVGAAVGAGMLHISRDLGFGDPYTGSVALVSGEIAEDIAHYLTTSEQTPSAVALGVLVETDSSVLASGGVLLQIMPGALEETVSILEENLANMGPISSVIHEGKDAMEIVRLISGNLPYTIHQDRPVGFKCNCSKERLERILISLGQAELRDIIDGMGKAELSCHFCGDQYEFNQAELEDLLSQIEAQGDL